MRALWTFSAVRCTPVVAAPPWSQRGLVLQTIQTRRHAGTDHMSCQRACLESGSDYSWQDLTTGPGAEVSVASTPTRAGVTSCSRDLPWRAAQAGSSQRQRLCIQTARDQRPRTFSAAAWQPRQKNLTEDLMLDIGKEIH
ncbi:hypothetical protein KIL84_001630 [Mauremys mutica]|uniref:Uncharacterized protein n=1 Tax=Mauremys mutica TaxID=74926 RepID=A0A9D3XJH4_9SAUR|nr:hypothetical protein KIL84_001630 [Mauremys mutica]